MALQIISAGVTLCVSPVRGVGGVVFCGLWSLVCVVLWSCRPVVLSVCCFVCPCGVASATLGVASATPESRALLGSQR